MNNNRNRHKIFCKNLLLSIFFLSFSLFCFSAYANPYEPIAAPKDLLEDMKSVISSFKKTKPIVMFQSPTCSVCDAARKDMKSLGLAFKEIDVTKLNTQPYWGRVVEVSGISGTPQILVGKKIFIGYSRTRILEELNQK